MLSNKLQFIETINMNLFCFRMSTFNLIKLTSIKGRGIARPSGAHGQGTIRDKTFGDPWSRNSEEQDPRGPTDKEQ